MATANAEPFVTPAVRKTAAALNVDLKSLQNKGTGVGGRIRLLDVHVAAGITRAAAAPAVAPRPASTAAVPSPTLARFSGQFSRMPVALASGHPVSAVEGLDPVSASAVAREEDPAKAARLLNLLHSDAAQDIKDGAVLNALTVWGDE